MVVDDRDLVSIERDLYYVGSSFSRDDLKISYQKWSKQTLMGIMERRERLDMDDYETLGRLLIPYLVDSAQSQDWAVCWCVDHSKREILPSHAP